MKYINPQIKQEKNKMDEQQGKTGYLVLCLIKYLAKFYEVGSIIYLSDEEYLKFDSKEREKCFGPLDRGDVVARLLEQSNKSLREINQKLAACDAAESNQELEARNFKARHDMKIREIGLTRNHLRGLAAKIESEIESIKEKHTNEASK